MSELRIVVAGAAGRMGKTVIRMIADASGCVVSGALEVPGKHFTLEPLRTSTLEHNAGAWGQLLPRMHQRLPHFL